MLQGHPEKMQEAMQAAEQLVNGYRPCSQIFRLGEVRPGALVDCPGESGESFSISFSRAVSLSMNE